MWTAGKLTDVRVRAAGAGTHGDGGGLYLAVKRAPRSNSVMALSILDRRPQLGRIRCLS
jgi:hypothetical protein